VCVVVLDLTGRSEWGAVWYRRLSVRRSHSQLAYYSSSVVADRPTVSDRLHPIPCRSIADD